jgi:alkaline phosphatase D
MPQQPPRRSTAPVFRPLSRRSLLRGGAGLAAGAGLLGITPGFAPAFAQSGRPLFTHGVQSGDVTTSRGMVWARADRPARLLVEVATSDSFKNSKRLRGPAAIEATDFDSDLEISQGMTFHVLSWLMATGRGDAFVSNTVLVGPGGAEVLTGTTLDRRAVSA